MRIALQTQLARLKAIRWMTAHFRFPELPDVSRLSTGFSIADVML